ncbi:MAG: pyridoxamine 5'-phosphate oxidase family protein [Clostridia bacterium]|nr:pyridoxamine 5'-phosphate oxidase family protein [Clostridia bacterium]
MEISYFELEKETVEILDKNKVWVLSTSENDVVTSRSMSIINIGLEIFFQTNKRYIKYLQMFKNRNVSLCFMNVSIEGTAEEIGDWKEERNAELLKLYKAAHKSSFDTYGMLDQQVVIKVIPTKVKYWKYIDGKPLRENLYVREKRAERIDFI